MNSNELNLKMFAHVLLELKANKRDASLHRMVELMLSLDECCGDSKHRVQPVDASDWRAVDNMVGLLIHNLCQNVAENIGMLQEVTKLLLDEDIEDGELVAALTARQLTLDISRNFINAQSIVVKEHYMVLNSYARVDGRIDADASLHYGRILKSIKELESQQDTKKHGNQEERGTADRCSIRTRSTDKGDPRTTH